jgi:uncharacterized damage-inducible protein DinB
MIRSTGEFLRYFDAVHRRAARDIAALPQEADGWTPAAGEGDYGWSINQIVGHMAGSRLYFVSAYLGRGWISPPPPDVSTQARWLSAIDESARNVRAEIERTPDEWLDRKIRMIDTDGALSGWRLLMMMLEHDVHHRSQLDAYAGINGWPVPDIFGRSAESIGALQAEQIERGGAR